MLSPCAEPRWWGNRRQRWAAPCATNRATIRSRTFIFLQDISSFSAQTGERGKRKWQEQTLMQVWIIYLWPFCKSREKWAGLVLLRSCAYRNFLLANQIINFTPTKKKAWFLKWYVFLDRERSTKDGIFRPPTKLGEGVISIASSLPFVSCARSRVHWPDQLWPFSPLSSCAVNCHWLMAMEKGVRWGLDTWTNYCRCDGSYCMLM